MAGYGVTSHSLSGFLERRGEKGAKIWSGVWTEHFLYPSVSRNALKPAARCGSSLSAFAWDEQAQLPMPCVCYREE